MVGVVRRVRVLWGVGVRRRSGSIGVGVKELWFDEGGIVQELLGLCGYGMKVPPSKLKLSPIVNIVSMHL